MDNAEQGQNTEEKIKDAARRIFIQKGFAGARMQQIADAAGINKALVHYYFRSKDQLFELIFKEAIGAIFPAITETANSNFPFKQKVEGFVATYIYYISKNPFIPLFVMNEVQTNPETFAAKYLPSPEQMPFPFMAKAIENAVNQGEIRPIDPAALLLNIVSLCIFPFAAKNMVLKIMSLDEAAFDALMATRSTAITDFVWQAICPLNTTTK